MYFAKDFIETSEGLIFAVVEHGLETDTVRCFLRYVYQANSWLKIDSRSAELLIDQYYPEYRYHSKQLDTALHGVPVARIYKHYQPRKLLQTFLSEIAADEKLLGLQAICTLFAERAIDLSHLGITGSLLLGLQNQQSDIDLVCYDRKVFWQLRHIFQALIQTGQLSNLTEADWLEAYQRRGCELSLDEYIFYEQRKFNKAMYQGTKLDLSLVCSSIIPSKVLENSVKKYGAIELQAEVLEDYFSFDYPAEYRIKHPTISRVLSFTATYSGQAKTGEIMQIVGQLEENAQGIKQVVIGSNREACGEYIRII